MSVESVLEVVLPLVRNGDDHTSRQIALAALLAKGPATVRGLAEEMNINKPAVTRAVDRLVGDLYAERLPDPVGGRRSVLVALTPAGKRFVAKF